MTSGSLHRFAALLGLLVPASATAQTFDLVEINRSPNPDHPGIGFVFFSETGNLAEATGVSVGDVDNDGFEDVMFVGTAGRPNELYINQGDGTFIDEAAARGVDEPSRRRGCSLLIDYDNDGDLDILTFGFPGLTGNIDLDLYSLFRNNGAPAYDFVDVTASAGAFALGAASESTTLGLPGGSISADVDGDGYLDVLAVYWFQHHSHSNTEDKDQFRLWMSEPNPTPDQGQPDYSPRVFVDRTLEAGLDGLGYENWMPVFLDVDRDGDQDLHLDVELGEDLMLLNDGDGVFGPNVATAVGLNYNAPSEIPSGDWGNEMGVAVGDMDNDGDLDLYLTNPGGPQGAHKEDALYRNDSDLSDGGDGLSFLHVGPEVGMTQVVWGAGWGTVFADMDNDGDVDLMSARGFVNPAVNTLYLNLFPSTTPGGNVAWQEANGMVPDFSRVGQTKDVARGLVALDYDNDGDLDVINTRSRSGANPPGEEHQAGVFRNTLIEDSPSGAPWLQVDLIENGGSRNVVGARVFVRAGGVGGVVQTRELRAGVSYLCQESTRAHFGLGAASSADWVAVRWADGTLGVVTASQVTLSGRVAVDRSTVSIDSTGDLDGDGDADCDDLAAFTLGRANPAALDALVAQWPWRIAGDADYNGLLDARDFALLRERVGGAWCDVGGALAGAAGEPSLTGSGALIGGAPMSIALSNARPGSLTWIVVGFSPLQSAGFFGGVLVPHPDLVIGPIPTSASGDLVLGAPWPAGLPSGFQMTFQTWTDDPAGPVGLSASNGLSALTP